MSNYCIVVKASYEDPLASNFFVWVSKSFGRPRGSCAGLIPATWGRARFFQVCDDAWPAGPGGPAHRADWPVAGRFQGYSDGPLFPLTVVIGFTPP